MGEAMMKNIFIRFKAVWFAFSLILIVSGIISMTVNYRTKGATFNYGIDFTGGTSMMLSVDEAERAFIHSEKVPDALREKINVLIEGSAKTMGINHIQITMADRHYFLVRTSEMTARQLDQFTETLKEKLSGLKIVETDFIGASIVNELQKQAVTIIFVAIFLLLIYITLRFEFWAALAAIFALVHDTLITLGLTAMLGIQVDAAFVAAILTILGYSINDTIVIFDRIRENTQNMTDAFDAIAELSIWQTLTRSIYTVSTVLIVLVSIYFFGGTSLKDFSLVLIIGIFFGCYSSIFIASPLLVMFKKWSE